MKNISIDLKNIPNVSETLIAVLAARAAETQMENPIIQDWYAVEIIRAIQTVKKVKVPKKLNVSIGLRTKAFDDYVLEFIHTNPNGIVLNLGCGMDTRYFRLDNGLVEWFDLDFPEVIDIRKHFFTESARYHMIGSSVLDFAWIEKIQNKMPRPMLIYAEGLFMYLNELEIKQLIFHLKDAFHGAHLIFENCDKYWVDQIQKRKYLQWKFRVRFHWDKSVLFRWGVGESKELSQWDPALKFIDENLYLKTYHKRWGWMKFMLKYPKIYKTMWLIHYQFA